MLCKVCDNIMHLTYDRYYCVDCKQYDISCNGYYEQLSVGNWLYMFDFINNDLYLRKYDPTCERLEVEQCLPIVELTKANVQIFLNKLKILNTFE